MNNNNILNFKTITPNSELFKIDYAYSEDKAKIFIKLPYLNHFIFKKLLQDLKTFPVIDKNRQLFNLELNAYEFDVPLVNQKIDSEAEAKINKVLQWLCTISQSMEKHLRYIKENVEALKGYHEYEIDYQMVYKRKGTEVYGAIIESNKYFFAQEYVSNEIKKIKKIKIHSVGEFINTDDDFKAYYSKKKSNEFIKNKYPMNTPLNISYMAINDKFPLVEVKEKEKKERAKKRLPKNQSHDENIKV